MDLITLSGSADALGRTSAGLMNAGLMNTVTEYQAVPKIVVDPVHAERVRQVGDAKRLHRCEQ